MEPFRERFKFLLRYLLFHLGFGLWFLIPVLNILFLSFAPVGATLFYLEQVDVTEPQKDEGGVNEES
jgi:CysZ protein